MASTAASSSPTPGAIARLTAAWDVRGIDIATVQADAATIRHTRRRVLTGSVETTLPPLLYAREGEAPPFTIGRTLGEGGMGIVRLAEQVALEREVAIKTLRPGMSHRAAAQLLREARVIGSLEHPNIVPVYALGSGEDGLPLIVMKRIEGTAWDTLLSASEPAERGRDAYLRRHLEILRQVANAAHFAHEKGIVHRDIKPANVMVGSHREVYLVDWGIAVSFREGGIRGVPSASEIAAIEGTPAYMAPEMAAGDGPAIDARSDVYLLGATLHEVLTGAPPHEGDELLSTLAAAYASKPKRYPEHIPAALADICRQAMAHDPSERFASAGELADALTRFLDHREAARLLEAAERDLARVRELAERPGDDRIDELYEAFERCRFAFAFALREWEDSREAEIGLAEAIGFMVEVELARGAPDAAATLLRELPRPDPALAERVQHAQKQLRQRHARLEQLRDEVDVRHGALARANAGVVLGIVWLGSWIAFTILARAGIHTIGHAEPIVASAACALLAAALMTRAYRRGLVVTVLARRLALSMPMLFLAHLGCWIVVALGGLSLEIGILISLLVCAVAFGATAVYIDAVNAPMMLALLLGLVGVLLAPAWHLEIYTLVSLLGTAATIYLTRNRPSWLPSDVMPP